MNFYKFLFLGNFLFISFNAFILIRYYILPSKLFTLSGLLFFKFLLRLIICNIFLYFAFFIGQNNKNGLNRRVIEIVLVSDDFENLDVSESQMDAILNNVAHQESEVFCSLSIFNKKNALKGVLIPLTTKKVFLNFINNIDFKLLRPLEFRSFIPLNLSLIKLNKEKVYLMYQNELIDLNSDSNDIFSVGENWYSINQLSIYLLILLMCLLLVDASFKFQILK